MTDARYSEHQPSPQEQSIVPLLVIGMGVFVAPLDSSANIAFPAIIAAFELQVPDIQWVVISYVLTYACLLLGSGRLGDIIGHRRLFLLGLAWTAVALTLCALAPSFGWLLVARLLQGFGAALILGSGPALATLSYAPAQRSRILGLYLFALGCAHATGPAIGGTLVELYGWQAVFLFRIPIVLLALLMVWLRVAPPPAGDASSRFDFTGAISLAIATGSALLCLNRGGSLGWHSTTVLGLASIALLAVLLFIWNLRRSKNPLIDPAMFRSLTFSAMNIAHVLANLGHFCVFLLVPFFLVDELAAPLWLCGLLLAHQPIGMTLASPLTGWLLHRMSAIHLAIAGAAMSAGGLVLVGMWSVQWWLPLMALSLFAQGFGHGVFQVASMDFVMGSLPRERQGVAGSLNMLTRTIGVVCGASGGALLFGTLKAESGFETAFGITLTAAAGVAMLATSLVVLATRTGPAR